MQKVIIVSIALEGYNILFSECIKSHKNYCRKYDYEYLLIDDLEISLKPDESSWIKISLIKNLIQKYDSVFFLDCDCYINDKTPPVYDFLYNNKESIFMAKGFSGRFNAGVMYFKSNSISNKFLEEVKSCADTELPEECRAPFENGHIIFIANKFKNEIYTLDTELWNNNIQLSDKSYIIHYSGGRLRPYYMKNHVSFLDKLYYKFFKRINRKVKKNIVFNSKIELLSYAESVIFAKYK